MAMPGEFEFYASRSGLPATANLAEHMRAYFAAELSLPANQAAAKSLSELEWLFYRANATDTQAWYTLGDLRMRYYAEKMALPVGTNVGDSMAAYFRNPPPDGPVEIRRNFCVNPSLEVNNTGWLADSATISRTTSQFHGGVASLGVTPGSLFGGTRTNFTPLVVGDYTASAWVMSLTPQNVEILCDTSSGPKALAAGVWQRISVTFNRPSLVAATVYISCIDVLAQYFVDEVLIEKSATMDSYFDGNTPDGGGFQYDWLGAAGNSVSTASTV